MSAQAPFPRHVLRFLHGGKVVTLIDHHGAQLDFQIERYRSILSNIDEKFRREHFSFGRLSSPSSPKLQRKIKRSSTILQLASTKTALKVEAISESSMSSSEEEQEEVSAFPQPSSHLLHFLRLPHSPKSLLKSRSAACSPVLSPQSRLQHKRPIPRFPKPTITQRCLGVGQDRRLGTFQTSVEAKKTRFKHVMSEFM